MRTTTEKINQLKKAKEEGVEITPEYVKETLSIKNAKLVEKYLAELLPPEPTDLRFFDLFLRNPNGTESLLKLVFQNNTIAILETDES